MHIPVEPVVTINFGQFLAKRAQLSPRLEATVEPSAGGRRLNFRELNERCNRVANALRAA
jgi:non-ribosomal peptide synthetase component F